MISNLEIYNQRMQKGMEDKLFFVDFLHNIYKENDGKITFVDYGCADGTLIQYVKEIFQDIQIIGIDNNLEMIKVATQNLTNYPDIHIFPSFNEFEYSSKWNRDNVLILNLSSVLHEVNHYSSPSEIYYFYNAIKELNFDYIFIRDMYWNGNDVYDPSKLLNVLSWTKRDYVKRSQLDSFQNCFGTISDRKNLVHFLLKYMYKENWSRECNEDYFSVDLDFFHNEFFTLYEVKYQLPYLVQKWKEDFDIEINETTHVRGIYRRQK